MSHPPSLSEAESGLKHNMILNEIQQYDSQFDAVARMHINIFTQVQSSGLTEIHVRAGALDAHRLRFEPQLQLYQLCSTDLSQPPFPHLQNKNTNTCFRKLPEFSESNVYNSPLAYGRYSRYCGYQLKPPFIYCFS